MTLSTQTPRVVITGNGTRGPYSLVDATSQPIRFTSTSHVRLTRYSASTDDNNDGSVLVENTDYTIGGTQDARTFTLASSEDVLTSNQRIVVERVQSYAQDLSLTTGGGFNAEAVQSRFDKVEEKLQELKASVSRAVLLQYADSTANVALPSPPTSATQVIGRNTSGELVHVTPASLGTDVALGSGWETLLGLPTSGVLDNLSGIRSVANNAALTALTTATGLVDNGVYQTLGRSTERDGGEGLWVYDSASTTTANTGTVLAIDGGGAGRFFRIFDAGRVQAEWFGALAGASASTNTAAINAALAVGPTYLTKAGSYAFGETGSTGVAFTMAAGYQFHSDPANVTLVAASGTYTTFNVTGSYTRVCGVNIDDAAKTAGYDHKIVCGSSSSIIETYFDDYLISSSPGVFNDSGSSTGVHYRTYIGTVYGGKATLLRGPGINWSRGWAFLSVGKADRPPDLAFDFTGSTSPNHTTVSIAQTGLPAGAGGVYTQISVLGSHGAGTTSSSQKGFVFTDVSDLWTAGSTADAMGGDGFLYDGCTHVNPSNSQTSLCDGHGMTFDDCAFVRGANLFIRGRAGVGSPTATRDGLRFANATTVVALSNVMSITNTGHGCHHTSGSSSEIHIVNLISRTNTLRGIKTTSGGVVAFVGGLTNANTAGNWDLGGALHSIHALVNAAGSQVNQDGSGTG